MKEPTLKISHTESHTDLLGPGDRYCLWVHGCCFDCEGCLARNTRFGAYRNVSVSALASDIKESGCDGITISGGEPFLQAEALAELVKEVQAGRYIGVIIYSGFTLEELKERSDAPALLSVTDILIDGPFILEQLNLELKFRGSDNQRVIDVPRSLAEGKAVTFEFE